MAVMEATGVAEAPGTLQPPDTKEDVAKLRLRERRAMVDDMLGRASAAAADKRRDTERLFHQLNAELPPEWVLDLWKRLRSFLRGNLRKADWDRFVQLAFEGEPAAQAQFNRLIRALVHNAQRSVPPPAPALAARGDEEPVLAALRARPPVQLGGAPPGASRAEQRLAAKTELAELAAHAPDDQSQLLTCLYPGMGAEPLPSGLLQAVPALRQPTLPFAFPEHEPAGLADNLPPSCAELGDLPRPSELAKRVEFYLAQNGMQPVVAPDVLQLLHLALPVYLKSFVGKVLSKTVGVAQLRANCDALVAEHSAVTAAAAAAAAAAQAAAAPANPDGDSDGGDETLRVRVAPRTRRAAAAAAAASAGSGAAAAPTRRSSRINSRSRPASPAAASLILEPPAKPPAAAKALKAESPRPTPEPPAVDYARPPATHILAAYTIAAERDKKSFWAGPWSASSLALQAAPPPSSVVRVQANARIDLAELFGRPADAAPDAEASPSSALPTSAPARAPSAVPPQPLGVDAAQFRERRERRRVLTVHDLLFAMDVSPELLSASPGQRELAERLLVDAHFDDAPL